VFGLVLTEQLGSFFHTTIINVSIHLNIHCIDYSALYTQLNHFYYLASLTVKFSDLIISKIAYSFLSSIPNLYNSSFDLFVEDEHNHAVMNQVAIFHSRTVIVVKRISSRNTYSREKRRTSSPIREAIESVKKLKTVCYFLFF
jgi:methionine synthase II (cobalamin-independent)